MKRQLAFAALAAVLATPVHAADRTWETGAMGSAQSRYATYSADGRGITLYCRNGLHEFIYGVPKEMVKWDAFDLVMIVKAKDGTGYQQVAVAWASAVGERMEFHLGRQPAWEFMSSVSGPNTITMGFSDLYLPERAGLYGEQEFVFGDGASEQAAFSVLTPCAPKEPEPEPSPIKPQ